jgi:hypothetical protein
MPDIIQQIRDTYATDKAAALNMLPELFQAAEDGKIVELPSIKLYKTLYWIWGDEIMPVKYMGIHHGTVDKTGKYHVVCRMHIKKDRTFFHNKRSFTYEAGDERWFYADDIGKTVFLTREAAEAALKERESNGTRNKET